MKTPTPEIRQALYRHLLCALPIGDVTNKDVAWPNAPFTPKAKRIYLAPFCLFNETTVAALSQTGFERVNGIFQVSVNGVLNTGEAEIEEIARVLTDHFRGGTVLQIDGWNPLRIERSYRNTMQIDTSGEKPRPVIVISANWTQYVQKGE